MICINDKRSYFFSRAKFLVIYRRYSKMMMILTIFCLHLNKLLSQSCAVCSSHFFGRPQALQIRRFNSWIKVFFFFFCHHRAQCLFLIVLSVFFVYVCVIIFCICVCAYCMLLSFDRPFIFCMCVCIVCCYYPTENNLSICATGCLVLIALVIVVVIPQTVEITHCA